jgi:bifunctional DNase/RNase
VFRNSGFEANSNCADQGSKPSISTRSEAVYLAHFSTHTCILTSPTYNFPMSNEVVSVQIRGILPANSGCAIFIGNEEKVFVIQVEHNLGVVIGMFLRDTTKERPLTHDLIVNVFKGFGVDVERVVINQLKNSTYYARLILKQENELGTKIVELDARPSDCLALAAAHKKPIYVAKELFDQVEDMTEYLERLNEDNAADSELDADSED